MKQRPIELVQAYDKLAIVKGYCKLFKKEENVPLDVWIAMYKLLSNAIKSARKEYPNRDFVITQSVYPYTVRKHLRSIFGTELEFIILNAPISLLQERNVERLKKQAADRNQKLEKIFLNSYT
eukprot:UN16460